MEMEGSVGLGQDPVAPGGSYTYEFTLRQHGTLFYHSHFSMQEMMGLIGFADRASANAVCAAGRSRLWIDRAGVADPAE